MAHWLDLGSMDDLGRLDTPVHRLDARIKAAVTLLFVAVVMSYGRYEVAALTPLVLYPLFLVAAGRIPAGLILRKLLIAAPFALVVGVFNPLLDRQPMMTIGSWSISGGWVSFASIVLRFALTVGAALTLVACTGMNRLVAGLEQLGLPRVFATQLLFLHRYVFVIAEEGGKMMRSVQLRAAGGALPLRTYGLLVGHLLIRAMDRAGRVHRAMVARGFDGEIRTGVRPGLGARDLVFAAGWIAFFIAARMSNPAAWLGTWLTDGAR